jgi:hypothetical protein
VTARSGSSPSSAAGRPGEGAGKVLQNGEETWRTSGVLRHVLINGRSSTAWGPCDGSQSTHPSLVVAPPSEGRPPPASRRSRAERRRENRLPCHRAISHGMPQGQRQFRRLGHPATGPKGGRGRSTPRPRSPTSSCSAEHDRAAAGNFPFAGGGAIFDWSMLPGTRDGYCWDLPETGRRNTLVDS